ncbi:UNVERIFIED_CONTAM: hypothetical protein Sradi_3165900 [Sesamum radiatum]|uniref:SWIM-type domain-containing protein n=1 Tax=Sesamum radiatum TaxID=300843 RepID=A0AAW2RF13_SESRA
MSLRHQVLVDFPDPKYEKYGKEPFVTIILYHGGKIIRRPKSDYVGGIKKDDDDGVSEGEGDDESDGLEDSDYDGGGDDSETDSNVDGCGDEDSGQEEVESSDSEDTTSSDDFDSVAGSDGEKKEPHPVFNPRNKYDPHFEIGMIFSNKIELREAIHSHAVSTKRSLKIFKNDKRRVYVKCQGDGCQWVMHALKLGEESTFQIRQYNPEHKCARSFNVKNMSSKWLSAKYEDAFRTDPKRNVKGFRKDVIKELRCHVSRNQAYRAKKKALEAIEGKAEDQFDSLWDYASELRKSNPGSTVMMVMTNGDDGNGQRKFSKFYVCFDALKKGFLSGCRPVIGVDGCHLKGHGGVLLTAVSIDPNNNLYPLAYAVVSGETREAWQWFLELLRDDLHIVRDDTFTFISDKQKGLFLHLSLCSLGQITDSVMEELGKLDSKVVEWLSDKPPAHWSRYVVNLQNHTCTCRKWDLTGIPCNHGMSAICSQSLEPEDFVNPCYTVATFIEVYKHAILPVNGPKLWEKTGLIPPLPPNFGRVQEGLQKLEDWSLMSS